MNKTDTRKAFLASIAKFAEGTTVKFVKGDKALMEVDGSVFIGIFDIAEKYAKMEEVEDKCRELKEMDD